MHFQDLGPGFSENFDKTYILTIPQKSTFYQGSTAYEKMYGSLLFSRYIESYNKKLLVKEFNKNILLMALKILDYSLFFFLA